MTTKTKIIEFFKQRENKPVMYYELLKLAGSESVARAVREMINTGELIEVEKEFAMYLQLKEMDHEVTQ